MVTEKIKANATDIAKELDWLKLILKTRSALNVDEASDYADVFEIAPPVLSECASGYAQLVKENNFGFVERFILILAAVPYIKPELLDVFIQKNKTTNQLYTEFGGRVSDQHSGFLPTGETVMFILAANDLARRFALLKPFEGDHVFAQKQMVWLSEVSNNTSFLNGQLSLSQEILDRITTGEVKKPTFSTVFPARLLETKMEWDDLILDQGTQNQLKEIEVWLQHQHRLMTVWGMDKKLKPGYKSLFYGPPGTGKSLTASLLGKKLGFDVYRIDLSQTVSKFIGETEKNLAKVFDKAESKDWILFFDEADALFGARTATKDAHDRYANQQVSYLLQRIEEYNGLVILASNLKSNIDDAFLRRFQTVIRFPIPSAKERYRLWQMAFSDQCELEKGIDLYQVANDYELAGGSIINAVQYASLMALDRSGEEILMADIVQGIKREYHKNGRTV
ncbi:ATP-binding protein [Pseudozobellia thermophila]|uniref:ATPase family associated with various cellular activities (AAA) n=1 Tax=Pseudozobellia thermophila TaxID=192903 RepID=A0A1M6M663_9FLAO|nr:ATP-binding protein [Pseudozobellia thermophila]SHJ78952.1 ATPase family associated with various cellular activities (AAA) [Pseudozobellia thermophila]